MSDMGPLDLKDGIFTVRYSTPEDLSPDRQGSIEAAIRQASLASPVGIVFVVGDGVASIDPAVPGYWRSVTGSPLVRIAAMAVVTRSPGVAIAARGFSLAGSFQDRPVRVRPFQGEAAAEAWVASVLDGTSA